MEPQIQDRAQDRDRDKDERMGLRLSVKASLKLGDLQTKRELVATAAAAAANTLHANCRLFTQLSLSLYLTMQT